MNQRIKRSSILIVALYLILQNSIANASSEETMISTHFYNLAVKTLDFSDPISWVSNYKNENILGLTSDTGTVLGANPLAGSTNPQHKIFLIDPTNGTKLQIATINYPRKAGRLYRTLDFLYNPLSSTKNIEVLLSFVSSESSGECRKVNVYAYSIPEEKSDVATPIPGKKYFESQCFPKSSTGDYRLHQSGGRIVLLPKKDWAKPAQQEILLSVGDFIKLAINSSGLSTKTLTQLGTVLKISKTRSETIATGLRNPQGLSLVNLNGKIELLETEHGPRGGDELNLLKSGFYGWPKFGYGTAYKPNDPEDKPLTEGNSGNSRLPLFSWLPSVAPSQLLQNSGSEFSKWWKASNKYANSGDILIGSLAADSIFRCRIEDGAVRYVESIYIGQRIRSFTQTPTGKIVIGSDSGKILFITKSAAWDSLQGKML